MTNFQKNELLYFNEKISSTDAQLSGLVTRVLDSTVSDEKVLTECARLAAYSAQVRDSSFTTSVVNHIFEIAFSHRQCNQSKAHYNKTWSNV